MVVGEEFSSFITYEVNEYVKIFRDVIEKLEGGSHDLHVLWLSCNLSLEVRNSTAERDQAQEHSWRSTELEEQKDNARLNICICL